MKENADKYLDDLSRKVIGKTSVKSTSMDFTSTVMSQIKAINNSKVTTYVPLISKRIWSLIGFGFAAIVVYVVCFASSSNSSWLNTWNLDTFQSLDLGFNNPIASFDVSQVTMYAIVFLALMLCVQIPVLKYYFNKRMD